MVWCYCDQTASGHSALAEVFNVVSIMCVDIGVFNGAVWSKHAVNSTRVYFKLNAYCLPLSVQSQILTVWRDCCCFWGVFVVFLFFFVCLLNLSQNEKKKRKKKTKLMDGTASTRAQRCSPVHWRLDMFGILSSLSLKSLREGKKVKTMHIIKMRNYWWTNPRFLLVTFISVLSSHLLIHCLLSASRQCIRKAQGAHLTKTLTGAEKMLFKKINEKKY